MNVVGHLFVEHDLRSLDSEVKEPNCVNEVNEGDELEEEIVEGLDDNEDERVIALHDGFEGDGPKGLGFTVPLNEDVSISKLFGRPNKKMDGDEYHSDELNSDDPDDSCDEERPKYERFRKEHLNKDYKFKMVMEFNTLVEFREAIREWSVLNGREITFVKNESYRVRVQCTAKCGFLVLCSKVAHKHTFAIKTLVDTHTCARVLDNKSANSRWVAKHVVKRLQTSDNVRIRDIMQDIRQNFVVGIIVSKAWKTKLIAKKVVEGDIDNQYASIWRYAAELARVNSSNTVKINVERPTPFIQPRFGSFYFCFDECKKGFINGCRPFVGVDGCHLKTEYDGQLLVAEGRDANDQYFPLAFEVVETETKESWRWFIQLLMEDIGQERRYVFIFDQHKGLVAVFEEMFDRIEHRLCLRHLYANFKKNFGGGSLIRDLMMGAAKATYDQVWSPKMNELKNVDQNAWSWLMAVPAKSWCKHAFTFYTKCDVLMNNISESFNATILVSRDKPILTMCEWIRKYLMNRLSTSATKLEKWQHKVMPIPKRRLDNEVYNSAQWLPTWHAVAALSYKKQNPKDFVDEFYTRDKFALCYGFSISPINGQDMLPEVEMEQVLLPSYKKGPGRHRKVRIRELGKEGARQRRHNVEYKCTKCDKFGHNALTCKSLTQDPNALKRKWKVKMTVEANSAGHNDGDNTMDGAENSLPTDGQSTILTDSELSNDVQIGTKIALPTVMSQTASTVANSIPMQPNKHKGKKSVPKRR
ncbi:uncharacterized protein LOC131605168 [Vicia villosa]|uniref:uncharacterized protein LOC131605168 n=1 Tax=Vicia villosa TaxID=3911 RepID=UPI00273AB3FB|nr:uncharacterized protein LOC131605168 [Vicia villosa]